MILNEEIKMKVGFVSLGCPKNQLDTEVMLHEVLSAGYEITPEETEADVVIINTCGFIENAKKEYYGYFLLLTCGDVRGGARAYRRAYQSHR